MTSFNLFGKIFLQLAKEHSHGAAVIRGLVLLTQHSAINSKIGPISEKKLHEENFGEFLGDCLNFVENYRLPAHLVQNVLALYSQKLETQERHFEQNEIKQQMMQIVPLEEEIMESVMYTPDYFNN